MDLVGRHVGCRGDKCRCVNVSNPKIEDVGAASSRRSQFIDGNKFRLPYS